MLFLIRYDRSQGRIITLDEFADGERQRANERRLAMELHLGAALGNEEVVLLQAEDQEALRRTHRRFFEEVAALMNTPAHGAPTVEET
jgi:hypothetical protein